jgi:hypothetical protein
MRHPRVVRAPNLHQLVDQLLDSAWHYSSGVAQQPTAALSEV